MIHVVTVYCCDVLHAQGWADDEDDSEDDGEDDRTFFGMNKDDDKQAS